VLADPFPSGAQRLRPSANSVASEKGDRVAGPG